MRTVNDGSARRNMDDDDVTAHVLQLAEVRADAEPGRKHRVRQAVLNECRVVARRRRAYRHAMSVAAGLSVAAILVIAARLWTRPEPVAPAPRDVIASVERVAGRVELVPAPRNETAVQSLTTSAPMSAGDAIETFPDSRLGFRFADGTSVRVDVTSRARLLSPTAIELTRGAVYVDAAATSHQIEIRTPLGTVRDTGTQFEVRLMPASLRVRVRSGHVAIRQDGQEVNGEAGTELLVSSDGIARRAVAIYGPEWAWTTGLAPAIRIDGRTLGVVLEEFCREQGWTLKYANDAVERASFEAILHGSIEVDRLSAEQALDVVLAASGFGHRLENGVLVVTRTPGRLVP